VNRDLAIGTAISLLLHGMLAYWAVNLPETHTLPPLEPKKLVKTVQEQIVLPKKPLPEPPKIEPPKPEPAAQAPTETPEPAAKPAPKPKSDAPKPPVQKPSEPAPLVLSKTYGASDGSGVAVNAGKDDTLGDPNVDPDEKKTRQRFVPKVAAPAQGNGDGEGDGAEKREVKIVHAVPPRAVHVDWPEGAENSGRTVEVTLLLEISEDGTVDKVRILRGAGEPFDGVAIAALKQQKFKPGTRDGKPFRDRVSFAVEFKPSR
jgi:TonB family protein